MSLRRGLRSRRISRPCYALAAGLACIVAAATAADDAAPQRARWEAPSVCLLPRYEPVDGRLLSRQTTVRSSVLPRVTTPLAAHPLLPRNYLFGSDLALLALSYDPGELSGIELVSMVPHWAARLDAELAGQNDVSRSFDLETYLARSRAFFLEPTPAPLEARAFELDCRVMRQARPGCEMPRCAELFCLPPQAAAEPTNNWLLMTSSRARPATPSGTMYLWSFAASAAEAAGNSALGARPAPSPSAGFVLTRPPGVYSIDWVGVAVTAPIH